MTWCIGGGVAESARFCAPRVEPEVAFLLRCSLRGPGVTVAEVRAATKAVAVALEVVDSRIADWKLTLPDTVADNASSGAVALGDWVTYNDDLALPRAWASLHLNGDHVDSGSGDAVMGDPAAAVAWLANALADYGAETVGGSVRHVRLVHLGGIRPPGRHRHRRDQRPGLGVAALRLGRTMNITSRHRPILRAGGQPRPPPRRPAPEHGDMRRAGHRADRGRGSASGIVSYAEIVSSISSKSAGPGTRANIDEFTETTSAALQVVGGAQRGKAVMILNPADPPILMRNTVYCLVDGDPDQLAIEQSVVEMVEQVNSYVPGYRLKQRVQFETFTPTIRSISPRPASSPEHGSPSCSKSPAPHILARLRRQPRHHDLRGQGYRRTHRHPHRRNRGSHHDTTSTSAT